jgi:hypothetical protein
LVSRDDKQIHWPTEKEQTDKQWPTEKEQTDKQWSTKHYTER